MALNLKKGDINLQEILQLSFLYYKKFDDKFWRSELDCKSIYITKRQNYHYDYSKKTWIQDGREAKIIFNVISEPTSYQKIDNIKKHNYPVTFLFRDISMGTRSAFRWRTGSLKRPIIAKTGKKYSQKERIQIAESNIRNGCQMDYFFNVMAVAHAFGLLYGINYTNRLPKKSTNVEHYPYLDKHALYICSHVLLPMLNKSSIIKKITD